MREIPLAQEAVSRDELLQINELFGAIALSDLMHARDLYQQLLIDRGTPHKNASIMAGVSQATMLAATACQDSILGGFTRPVTTSLVVVNFHSVAKMFTNATNNDIFYAPEGELAPSQRDGVARENSRRSQVYHVTGTGQTLFDAFTLG